LNDIKNIGDKYTMAYSCKQCEYKTDRKIIMDNHMAKHVKKETEVVSDDEPKNSKYTCEFCDTKMSSLSNLRRHERSCGKRTALDVKYQNELAKRDLIISENNKMIAQLRSEIDTLRLVVSAVSQIKS
jgi:hypothetical protein